jgi:tetratricopeptide (TPR) repeat protein
MLAKAGELESHRPLHVFADPPSVLNAPDPDPEAERLAQAAMQAFNRGARAVAADLARQLLLRRPDDPRARQVLGVIALDAGDHAAARAHLEAVASAWPERPVIANLLGVALSRLGDAAGARAAFTRAGELGFVDGWRNLASLEADAGDGAASIAAYQRALALAPGEAATHALLAHAFERRHDLAQAKAHAAAAIAADADNAIARVALARALLREKDYAGAEAAAAPVAQSPRASRNDRAVAWGVIGDARDQNGQAHAAFQAFAAANRLVLEQHRGLLGAAHELYHPDGVRRMTRLAAEADVSAWRAPSPPDAPPPVFLVGFPRSGTTLLDQILSSHSRIVCLEEKEHFSNALREAITTREKLAAIGALSEAEIATIRSGYWRRVRAEESPPRGGLVVDKLPLNIVVLPLIKRVFPEAKIIFALRDPRDAVLSCYQQRFGMNAAMAQFLQLETAAAYYDVVMTLFELCRERLGLDLHQVRYEDVVADLESAARGLAAFLGLPFEEAMLRFRETALRREISTPSARQVIQPLYSRSIGRWRRYAEDLAPVLPQLDRWAARFGYDMAREA